MSDELMVEGKFGQPYLLNDDDDKKLELTLNVRASNQLRERFSFKDDYGVEVCMVLDISESMYDFIDSFNEDSRFSNQMSKIDVAIREIENLIEKSRDKDILSLVVYDSKAHVVFEGVRGFDKNLMYVELDKIKGEYVDTNISAGLRAAREILTKQMNNDKIKRIIFITDGVPYGIDNEENIINESYAIAEDNITIDCFGIGEEFNYELLEKIAAPSNGKTFILKDNKDKSFYNIFQKAQEVIMTNAKIKLKFSKMVTVEEYYRGLPQNIYIDKPIINENGELTINVGQIEKNQKYTYYIKVNIPAQPGYSGPLRIAEVEMEYCVPRLYGSRLQRKSQNLVVKFGGNPNLITTDGDVKSGYKIAYVKMLENEIENAQKFNDYITIIRRYNQIMKIYKELDFQKEFEIYNNVFEEYKKNGSVSRKITNEAKDISSKAGEKGVLTQTIPKGFIRRTNRRGGM